jgi:hypothetical protein
VQQKTREALAVLDEPLVDAYGAQRRRHGPRGAHCWRSDHRRSAATIAGYLAPAEWQALLPGVQFALAGGAGRNPGEKMIRVVALLFLIGIAAQAECVVYSTACKAGADWLCYGKVHE